LQLLVEDVRKAEIQNTFIALDSTINSINHILTSEEGTVGLLLNDTQLHDNLNAALQSLDKAVVDVDSVIMSIKARPFIRKKLK
jgi:hypothetical protein